MQSKATTVEKYLAELPADRRAALEVVRRVILKNLDNHYEEGMAYGAIGYCVPHRVFPQGYHCDSKQALPFAALASQKNYMSLYLMCCYGEGSLKDWFNEAWAKSGKKLDMGKSCIRFKSPDDLALDVIGEVIRRVPAKKYIANYVGVLERTPAEKSAARAKSAKRTSTKPASATKAPSKRPSKR